MMFFYLQEMTAEDMTAQETGNTKAVSFRARAFLLTLN